MGEASCIFCSIVRKDTKTELLYESADIVCFPDRKPLAPVHILIVPKRHIPSVLELEPEDAPLLIHMTRIGCQLALERGLDKGHFRLYFNGGAFLEVRHLHLHLVGRP